MSNKETKLLFEGWRKFINEDADPAKIDTKLFPPKLSQVNTQTAEPLALKGLEDKVGPDDTLKADFASIPAQELKPFQQTMDLVKFVGMAISNIISDGAKAGGDLAAVISQDNYIMDGHHRWAGTILTYPDKACSGLKVQLAANKLVGVLNVYTKGALKKDTGNAGATKFSELTPELIKQELLNQINKGSEFFTTDVAKQAFAKYGGGNFDAGVQKVANNAKLMTKNMPTGPDRPDMPVIDGKLLNKLKADLNSGNVDMNPPYSPSAQDALKGGTAAPAAPAAVKENLLKNKIKQLVLQEMKRLKR